MPKAGRNEPCPCGSGKKYKRCCLERDQQLETLILADERAARAEAQAELEEALEYEEQLAHDSNAVVDLVHAGKLDEAERAARELLVRYPDMHDGYDRLGMVYEARGDNKLAAHCYRQVLELVRAHPEDYEPDFTRTFQRLIDRLDPPAAVG